MVDNKPVRTTRLSFASIVAACMLSGCAHNFSSELFTPVRNSVDAPVFQALVLAVDPPRDGSQTYQLEKFVETLREAQLFKAVEYPNRGSSADLILTAFSFYMTNPLRACFLGFQGQVLTIGTLGLFPQLCKSEFQVSFALVAPRDKAQRKTMSLTYQTRSIMGWAGLFYMLLPDWTAHPPREQNTDVVKAAFYRDASEIQKLVRK
jgi:hypothetical protein